jgi:excisionase family DNA binding protein
MRNSAALRLSLLPSRCSPVSLAGHEIDVRESAAANVDVRAAGRVGKAVGGGMAAPQTRLAPGHQPPLNSARPVSTRLRAESYCGTEIKPDQTRKSLHEGSGMDDRWLSVDDISAYLGVARDTIYSWVASKGMPGHKVGRYWKFKRDEVDAWVRAGGASSDQAKSKKSESDE